MCLSTISLVPEHAASVTAVLSARSSTKAAPGAGGHDLGRDGDAVYPDLPRRRLIFKCMFSGLRRAAGCSCSLLCSCQLKPFPQDVTERGSNRVPTFCVNRAARLREVIFPVHLGFIVQHCSRLYPHQFLRLSVGQPKILSVGKAVGARRGCWGQEPALGAAPWSKSQGKALGGGLWWL